MSHLADKEVSVIKVASVELWCFTWRIFNLYAHFLALAGVLYRLVVELNTADAAHNEVLARHTQRRAVAQNAAFHDNAADDRITAVEDVLRQDAHLGRKDSQMLVLLLVRFLQILSASSKELKELFRCRFGDDDTISKRDLRLFVTFRQNY